MTFTPNRRQFMKIGAMSAGALLLLKERVHAAFAQSPGLRKFVQPLRQFGVEGGIPIATTAGSRYGTGVDYYEIAMRQYTDVLHPAFEGNPTTLWGYTNAANDASTYKQKHLEGAIVAAKDRPVRVRWSNELGEGPHILPVDNTVVPENLWGRDRRIAPHLHGGLVPWLSDGGPFHWMDTDGTVGTSVLPWLRGLNADGTPSGNDYDYWYPNTQTARMMWYHDHAVGTTRLNAYAGLATGYLLKDGVEADFMAALGSPAEVPLVVQDKVFTPEGQLWYPNTYDQQFFALGPGEMLPDVSLVPEFWGDTMLVNGTAYPFLEVAPRVYRFQLLNACNTRFLRLRLLRAVGKAFPEHTEGNPRDPGPIMRVIGTEGGFLDPAQAPQGVVFDNKSGALVLAPAERADILIDFSKVKPGTRLILYNDAPVPFPGGTPLADFHSGNNKLATPPTPGSGPDTRNLLQFVVGEGTPRPLATGWTIPDVYPTPRPAATGITPTDLGLYETMDDYGRLAQNIGDLSGAGYYLDRPTEFISPGLAVWRLFNLSADTHPIHFHYFNVRVLSRQAFNVRNTAPGAPAFTGSPIPPAPEEEGWKETVRANPGECITLLVEVPGLTGAMEPVPLPNSPRLAEYGVTGHEYVYHCHILEHEEHDMMRPLVFLPR